MIISQQGDRLAVLFLQWLEVRLCKLGRKQAENHLGSDFT